jgi:hypothetical protein
VAALAGAKRRLNEKREPHHKARAHSVYRSTITKIRAMQIIQNEPARKPERERLPNRRAAETLAFERDNLKYQMTTGLYPDGRIGEIFLSAAHANSLLDVLAHDAAIAVSLALQFGCPLETIRHALKRDSQGVAASPIGAALDLITR